MDKCGKNIPVRVIINGRAGVKAVFLHDDWTNCIVSGTILFKKWFLINEFSLFTTATATESGESDCEEQQMLKSGN